MLLPLSSLLTVLSVLCCLPARRECFARMNVLDPHLRLRLAEWLAYHLSNFEYVWPWTKWQHVLAAPAYDGQR